MLWRCSLGRHSTSNSAVTPRRRAYLTPRRRAYLTPRPRLPHPLHLFRCVACFRLMWHVLNSILCPGTCHMGLQPRMLDLVRPHDLPSLRSART